MHVEPTFIIVDLFCGAGGTTTGYAMTGGRCEVIACVNHDHYAILSHWANHENVKHFEEDIRKLDLAPLKALVAQKRAQYPNALLILWASLECTNFSKAKGGLARDADSRTLADHLQRYIDALCPDYVKIENVVEFRDWGPSRIKMRYGKPVIIKNKHGEQVFGYEPIPERKGEDFRRWCGEICARGYDMDWRELNSANYGAYTSRNRLFGIFAKPGLPFTWPEPTHHKTGKNGLLKWNAVKEKLDFTDEGYNILHRGSNPHIPKRQRKDLTDNTLVRVYGGLIKQVAGGKKAFMLKYHGGKPRTNHLDKPLTVIDTQNRHALVAISFLSKYYSGNPYNKNISTDGPAGTIKTVDGHALVQAFFSTYHGNGDNTHSVDGPAPTLAAADINAIVFIDRDFSGGGNSSIEEPVGSILSVPKLNIVQAKGFIDTQHYNRIPNSVEEPHPTITANRKHPYLISLQYGGQMSSVERPCPTLLATGDKTPIYLLITKTGEPVIQIFDTDSEIVKSIKEFMALYGITEIKMRMLREDELLQIQGFPAGYILLGSKSDQKKFIGNSVVPNVVTAWANAMYECSDNKKIA